MCVPLCVSVCVCVCVVRSIGIVHDTSITVCGCLCVFKYVQCLKIVVLVVHMPVLERQR